MQPKKTSKWATARHTLSDGGPLLRKIYTQAHEPGQIIAHNEQPDKDIIYERNKRLRNDPGSVQDMEGLGRLALTIPLDDYYDLLAKYPALKSSDAKTRSAAWARIMNTQECEKFRTRDRV